MRQFNIPNLFSVFWIKRTIWFVFFAFTVFIFVPSTVEAVPNLIGQECLKNDFSYFVGTKIHFWLALLFGGLIGAFLGVALLKCIFYFIQRKAHLPQAVCGQVQRIVNIFRELYIMNTFDDFLRYCKSYNIELNKNQTEVAKMVFNIPCAGGKTTLIVLLRAYDPSSDLVFNNMGSELGLYQNTPRHKRCCLASSKELAVTTDGK